MVCSLYLNKHELEKKERIKDIEGLIALNEELLQENPTNNLFKNNDEALKFNLEYLKEIKGDLLGDIYPF